ncbi:MAG: sigma-70 family RNA polymerase sigma factor [Actinomycetia bacterium]|nr:sigma-70 family RNA polymerase sigma factor [Actinomycetes bacterium]
MVGRLDDEELLRRCRAGDQDGYAELFRRYRDRAYRLAYVITGDPGLSEDVTQEAFIQAFRRLENVRPGSPFGPWFFAIVAHCARRQGRARRTPWLALPAAESLSDTRAADALDAVESEVWRAVQDLPVDLRVLVALRYVLDLTEAEAAHVLRLPLGTVKSRLHRARRLLRQALDPLVKEADPAWTTSTR